MATTENRSTATARNQHGQGAGRSYYWRRPAPELVEHVTSTRPPSARRHTASGSWLVYDLTREDRARFRTRKRKVYVSAETREGYG